MIVFVGIYFNDSGRLITAISNSPFLVISFFSLFELINGTSPNYFYADIISLVGPLGFYLFLLYINFNFLKRVWNVGFLGKIFLIILLIIFSVSVSQILGTWEGNRTLNGNSIDVYKIQLKFHNFSNQEIQNKSLLLFFYHNANYYTIEVNQTAKNASKIYIFPENNLDYVIINR